MPSTSMSRYDCIIIGGGPAGLAAAIYTGRARIKTLVLEKGATGGQLLLTDNVENYPGFIQTDGGQLMEKFLEQAQRFGAELGYGEVREVHADGREFGVVTEEQTYAARSVIVATGSSHRHLGVPGEQEFWGKGVSVCATCDGAFFRDQVVSVVGGGDSALTEALFLKNLCSTVQVIHRREELRAERILHERATAAPNIKFIWNSVVQEIVGEQTVTALRIRDVKTNSVAEIPTSAVFVSIGMTPNSIFLRDFIRLDHNGYVLATHQMATSRPGIFVAGDVRTNSLRQVATSVGDGVTAAMSLELWLEDPSLIPPYVS
ncbi:MAG: thioredoxin-disulfide reductase [Acidobacteriota bacterium]